MSWCGVYKVGPGLSERLRACPSFEAHLGNVHAHRVNISLKWPRWIISVAATTAWPDGLRTSENCAYGLPVPHQLLMRSITALRTSVNPLIRQSTRLDAENQQY